MRVFYRLAYPVLVIGALFAGILSTKIRKGLIGRMGLTRRLRRFKFNQPFWFHVASSGELEQAIPVMEELKKLKPDCQIVLSIFSPSGKRGLELEVVRRNGEILPWDFADYSVLDFSWALRTWFSLVKPRALVCINKELWPEMLWQAKDRNVPIFLFATYFSNRASWKVNLLKPLFRQVTYIGTVLESTCALLGRASSVNDIQALGDPRVDRVMHRKSRQKHLSWSDFFAHSQVALFASLWPADFEALKPTLLLLLEKNWRMILVPHEPTHVLTEQWLQFLKEHSGQARRWTHWLYSPDDSSHLVVDTVGVLAELYRVAEFVFVGGSFKSRIHNVLEPAAYGCPLFTGPHIENSPEAMELCDRGLIRAKTAERLKKEIEVFLGDSNEQKNRRHQIEAFMIQKSGAGARYAQKLLNVTTEFREES